VIQLGLELVKLIIGQRTWHSRHGLTAYGGQPGLVPLAETRGAVIRLLACVSVRK
jgi:hypothetical protein